MTHFARILLAAGTSVEDFSFRCYEIAIRLVKI